MTIGIEDKLQGIQEQIGRKVMGYDEVVRDLLLGLLLDGHVLLEGVPGLAKTTVAKEFARCSDLTFNRVQYTQDLLPADVTGHSFFNPATSRFELRKGPVFSNLLLADEINRAPPRTQSALLEAMEERQVTIDGQTLDLPEPFMVIATLNPVDTGSVYPLPEAQLDRFMLRIRMGYLPEDLELDMLATKLVTPGSAERVLRVDEIREAREAVRQIHTERPVLRYIQQVTRFTRNDANVTLGASPRAMEHLLQASRGLAFLQGRSFVTPDDVKAAAPKVFAHRLILNVDAEVAGETPDEVVLRALTQVEVPKELEPAR